MPEWTAVTEADKVPGADLSEALWAEKQMNALLQESMADLESLYRDDVGWQKVGLEDNQFSGDGRKRIAAYARIMATANPLVKRGLGLRVAYVWGQGVTVSVRDDGATGQDVNAVLQQFWDDKSNLKTFTGSQASDSMERQLGTDGEVFLALPTNTLTGRVRVRSVPPEEIVDLICDPEDAATIWYYKRKWTARIVQADGKVKNDDRVTYYPAVGYYPLQRPLRVNGSEIRWDAPMVAAIVNSTAGSNRGIGDSFAALPWARASKEFLEDWAMLAKALSRIAWQVKTRADKTQQAARAISRTASAPGNDSGVGGTVGMTPGSTLEAVPKTGATIDANSGRPLQMMVAAALGVPLTMLLGDPGATGARAVAETLDQPTELEMGLRRKVWSALFREVVDYVIDAAVIAPRGALRGAVVRDDDRRLVTLPDGDDRTIEVNWPEWDSTPVDILVKAIAAADSTEKLPPLEVFKLLARALNIPDSDDLIEDLTDDQGRWIPQDVRDTMVRSDLGDRGQGDGA